MPSPWACQEGDPAGCRVIGHHRRVGFGAFAVHEDVVLERIAVIYEYNTRVNGRRSDGGLVAPPISENQVRALIPHFAELVADLIAKGWIEVREAYDTTWDDTESMTEAQITDTLADPDAWIWDADGGRRMVMIMPTDQWDALFHN
jgi:hypothetical protein